MIKRYLVALTVLLAFAAGLAFAAPATVAGKIAAIDGKKVQIELVGEKADWVKKGAAVKFKGGVGRIVEVTDTTISFNSKNAAELKVGDEITLDKGPATLAGC